MNLFEVYSALNVSLGKGTLTTGINYTPAQNNCGNIGNIYVHTKYKIPIPNTGLTANAHIGYEDGAFAYGGDKLDWGIGVSYDFKQFSVGIDYIDTNKNNLTLRAGLVAYATFLF